MSLSAKPFAVRWTVGTWAQARLGSVRARRLAAHRDARFRGCMVSGPETMVWSAPTIVAGAGGRWTADYAQAANSKKAPASWPLPGQEVQGEPVGAENRRPRLECIAWL